MEGRKFIAQTYLDSYLFHEIIEFTGNENGYWVECVTKDHTTWANKDQIIEEYEIEEWRTRGNSSVVFIPLDVLHRTAFDEIRERDERFADMGYLVNRGGFFKNLKQSEADQFIADLEEFLEEFNIDGHVEFEDNFKKA